jgi:hypothetical protein
MKAFPVAGDRPIFSAGEWCGRRDSNPHIFRYWYLKPARLPIPPRPQNRRSPKNIKGRPIGGAAPKGKRTKNREPRNEPRQSTGAIARRRRGGHSAGVTTANSFHRSARLALSLVALAGTAGCAHFRDAEIRAQQRTEQGPAEPGAPTVTEPAVADREPPPTAVPTPMPPAVPSVAPSPAPAIPPAEPAPAAVSTNEPVPSAAAPVVATPAPETPANAPAPEPAIGPATDSAIIILANTPGARCGACETVKISVAPSGQVLIERGHWAGVNNWSYKRSVVHVGATRAAAFAASLSADRPTGQHVQTGGANCPSASANGGAAQSGGLVVEWIEADRHDLLNVPSGCRAGPGSQVAERLRHAPDLLGLHGLVFPEGGGQ